MKIEFSGRRSCSLFSLGSRNILNAASDGPSFGDVVLVEVIEVEITQFVVADLMGKHVIDGHQDFMGYRYGRALVSTSGFETVKFVLK